MKRLFLGSCLAAVAVASAAPVTDPVELLRLGNAAFARGDYAAAVNFYTKAEVRTTDPGLVALNKASALYHLGNYRAAELLYRASLSDAEEPRRLRSLYSLANCLVQQAADRYAKSLKEAIDLYQQCLSQSDTDLADDARHNLELAKMLLLRAQTKHEKDPDEKDPDHDPQTNPPAKSGAKQDGTPDPGPGDSKNGGQELPGHPNLGHQTPTSKEQPSPGKGNLPPIPDTQDPVAMTHEDAAAHLEQATTRILQERQKHKHMSFKKPAPGVKDW
ncbi:MAG: tetratricopeptide repeat protein [Gemmataceae bacterium]